MSLFPMQGGPMTDPGPRPATQELNIGDVVRLNGSDVNMTCVRIGDSQVAYVQWMDSDHHLQSSEFPVAALSNVSAGKRIALNNERELLRQQFGGCEP